MQGICFYHSHVIYDGWGCIDAANTELLRGSMDYLYMFTISTSYHRVLKSTKDVNFLKIYLVIILCQEDNLNWIPIFNYIKVSNEYEKCSWTMGFILTRVILFLCNCLITEVNSSNIHQLFMHTSVYGLLGACFIPTFVNEGLITPITYGTIHQHLRL